jgi:hypothetical protein
MTDLLTSRSVSAACLFFRRPSVTEAITKMTCKLLVFLRHHSSECYCH